MSLCHSLTGEGRAGLIGRGSEGVWHPQVGSRGPPEHEASICTCPRRGPHSRTGA